eukprot:g16906.t1
MSSLSFSSQHHFFWVTKNSFRVGATSLSLQCFSVSTRPSMTALFNGFPFVHKLLNDLLLAEWGRYQQLVVFLSKAQIFSEADRSTSRHESKRTRREMTLPSRQRTSPTTTSQSTKLEWGPASTRRRPPLRSSESKKGYQWQRRYSEYNRWKELWVMTTTTTTTTTTTKKADPNVMAARMTHDGPTSRRCTPDL